MEPYTDQHEPLERNQDIGPPPEGALVASGARFGSHRSRVRLRTIAIGAVPFVLMPLLGLLVGAEWMSRIMLYSAPLLLVPLVLGVASRVRERRGR